MGQKKQEAAYRRQNMNTDLVCLICQAEKLESVDTCLTEYPILDVLICPKCGTRHIKTYDKVLCTEAEFTMRIGKSYS